MPLDMNPEIRARWTAALRSGDYQQGREALRGRDPDGGPDLFCCLGVLCDLAAKDGIVSATPAAPDDVDAVLWYYDGRGDYLPEAVKEWAGLDDCNPLVPVRPGARDKAGLAVINDEKHWSFAQIADAIDGGAS